jgi:hypothetical protein
VLGVDQEQRQRIRTRGAGGGQVHRTGCDPQALKLEDRGEAVDADPDCGEDYHCARHGLVHMLEQLVEGYRDEDHDRRLEQVGDYAETHESGVGN